MVVNGRRSYIDAMIGKEYAPGNWIFELGYCGKFGV